MPYASAFLTPMSHPQSGGNNASSFAYDCTAAGLDLKYDVRAFSHVMFQGVFSAGANTAVFTVYRSLDGVTPLALETPQTFSYTTLITGTIDVSGIPYLIVRLTTTDADITCNIFGFGKDVT
jgi:hypothetical protein